MAATRPAVVFPRAMHEGTQGLDVVAAKRALSRAGYIKWPAKGKTFSPFYGPFMQEALHAFAAKTGHDASKGYTKTLHDELRGTHAKAKPTEWAFDQLAVSLEAQEFELLAVTPEQRVRAAIVAAGWFWYQHRASIGYAETRPFQLGRPPFVPSRLDCSAYVTVCHYAGGAPNPNGRAWDGLGYCHEPGALVLTSDLRWVPAGDVKAGDELWAFDADRGAVTGRQSRRRFRRATVLTSFPSQKACVRVCTNMGEYVCSADHPWLAQRGTSTSVEWVEAGHLTEEHRLIRPFDTWKQETSYDAGWLAGMFDGEGWTTNRGARGGRTNGVGITQTLGLTADRLVEEAKRRGDFHVAVIQRDGVKPRVNVTTNGGGMAAAAAFLGRVRPERLIANFNIEGGEIFSRHDVRVEKVERVGWRDVQSIQTTTGTYIAEGFAVHNTGTLMSRGERCSLNDLMPGDAVFYGYTTSPTPAFPYGSPTHVALFAGYDGHVPMVLSNGGYPMHYLPLTYRGVNHYRHYTVA